MEISLNEILQIISKKSKYSDSFLNWLQKNIRVCGESDCSDLDEYKERCAEDGNELTGHEVLKGNYWVYDYGGHDGTAELFQYNELSDVEDFIVRFYDNPFVNEIIVFIDGKETSYEVYGPLNKFKRGPQEYVDEIGLVETIKEVVNRKVRWL
ncbi:hypothetical protein D3C75_763490 [compost metagenome]